MKIGLLTVHGSVNYGASLQAYALFKTLANTKNDVKIINYTPVIFSDLLDKRKYRGFKNFVINGAKFVVFKKQIVNKHKAFKDFSNKYLMPQTEFLSKVDDSVIEKYGFDMVICGSDQIWNPMNTLFDTNFFFSNIKKDVYKASYAASIGMDKIEGLNDQFIKNNIQNMDRIAVREDSAVEYLTQEVNIPNVTHVLDPVFLLNETDWMNLEETVEVFDKYIFLYALGENQDYIKIVEDISRKQKLKVVVLQAGFKNKFKGDIIYKDLGPCEFLYLIRNAEIVVTNSFHGTAFSLLFNKKLIVFGNNGKNTRMDSLLRLLNLTDMMVGSYSEYLTKDWEKIWEIDYKGGLEENIKLSKNYLNSLIIQKGGYKNEYNGAREK